MPRVQRWLRDCITEICLRVPDTRSLPQHLAGVSIPCRPRLPVHVFLAVQRSFPLDVVSRPAHLLPSLRPLLAPAPSLFLDFCTQGRAAATEQKHHHQQGEKQRAAILCWPILTLQAEDYDWNDNQPASLVLALRFIASRPSSVHLGTITCRCRCPSRLELRYAVDPSTLNHDSAPLLSSLRRLCRPQNAHAPSDTTLRASSHNLVRRHVARTTWHLWFLHGAVALHFSPRPVTAASTTADFFHHPSLPVRDHDHIDGSQSPCCPHIAPASLCRQWARPDTAAPEQSYRWSAHRSQPHDGPCRATVSAALVRHEPAFPGIPQHRQPECHGR